MERSLVRFKESLQTASSANHYLRYYRAPHVPGIAGSHSPAARKPTPPCTPPKPAPAQHSNGSMMQGFGASIVDGLAVGAGRAMAQRAVDSVIGPLAVRHEIVASSAPDAIPIQNSNNNNVACVGQSKALQDCLNSFGSDISKCQFYMDTLQECRRSSGTVLGG